VDADVPKSERHDAYGEVVWSWRPSAGVKLGDIASVQWTNARKRRWQQCMAHRGEHEV